MKYLYTIGEDGEILEYAEYVTLVDEELQENQTLVQYEGDFINPRFSFEKQEWYEGESIKQSTPEELLTEQLEFAKTKTITEFELRKMLAEQNKNIMQMMMMLTKK